MLLTNMPKVCLGRLLIALAALSSAPLMAQEPPYFVTYDHHMEEPGKLEVSLTPTYSSPRKGNAFLASSLELEYGTRAWWTTALYLDSQSTFGDSSLFTGVRLENRFRLLMNEHAINPVFYIELLDGNGAGKVMKE